MSTHSEIKREIFKSVLRRYFFENPGTMYAFSNIDINTLRRDEQMKAIIDNNPDNPSIVTDLWEATQERVFNKFFNRVLSSGLLNEKGEPYKLSSDINGNPELTDEFLDDFMSGKKIAFMGAGPDSMMSISADKDELNQLLVYVNTVGQGKKERVPRIYEKVKNLDGTDGHTIDYSPWSMEDSLSITYGTAPASETPPKSNFLQNLANTIKKWFTGRPTDLWAPYEKYQKMQELQTAVNIATNYKNASNELDSKNIEAAQKSVSNVKWQKALSDIIAKQKKKAAEELQAKQGAEKEELQEDNEDLTNKVQEETKNENVVVEGTQKMPEETVEYKQLHEELRKEDRQKLSESDERRNAIEAYRREYIGTEVFSSKQKPLFIAKEKHFMSVFAPGPFRENATPEAVDMISTYLETLKEYADANHVDDNKIDKLPEMLANVYILGKLISTYPDRYDTTNLENIKECPYEELPEYNQILERFDLVKKNLTTFIKETNLPASIVKDPKNVISNMVLNPKTPFYKRIDSFFIDQGAYTTVSNKIKGIKTTPKVVDEKQKDQSKGGLEV